MAFDHLSYSTIKQYMDCGLQLRFKKLENLEPEFISDALVFGSSVHKALAKFNSHRADNAKPQTSDLTHLFETYWTGAVQENGRIRYANGNDFNSCLEQGKHLLEVFYEKFPRDTHYRVLDIEKEFKLELEDFPWPVIGFIDLVETDEQGNLLITEYKTSSKAYSTNQIDLNEQVTLYHLAVQNLYPNKQVITKIDCLIKTKTPKFEQYYTYRCSDDHNRFVKIAREVARGIEAEVFIPNLGSWKCGYCEFKTACEDWLKS